MRYHKHSDDVVDNSLGEARVTAKAAVDQLDPDTSPPFSIPHAVDVIVQQVMRRCWNRFYATVQAENDRAIRDQQEGQRIRDCQQSGQDPRVPNGAISVQPGMIQFFLIILVAVFAFIEASVLVPMWITLMDYVDGGGFGDLVLRWSFPAILTAAMVATAEASSHQFLRGKVNSSSPQERRLAKRWARVGAFACLCFAAVAVAIRIGYARMANIQAADTVPLWTWLLVQVVFVAFTLGTAYTRAFLHFAKWTDQRKKYCDDAVRRGDDATNFLDNEPAVRDLQCEALANHEQTITIEMRNHFADRCSVPEIQAAHRARNLVDFRAWELGAISSLPNLGELMPPAIDETEVVDEGNTEVGRDDAPESPQRPGDVDQHHDVDPTPPNVQRRAEILRGVLHPEELFDPSVDGNNPEVG